MKRKPILLLIHATLVFTIVSSTSCMFWNKKPQMNVVIRIERKDTVKSSLLVLNLKEPLYAEGAGAAAAEIFHRYLLKSKKFRVVSLCTDSPWDRVSDQEETRLLNALEEARRKNFDYVLAGELSDYYYGGIHTSRVTMKIRVMEVASRITVFLAEYSRQNEARDPSYPMNTKLSGTAQHPDRLVDEMVREVINEM